MSDLGYQNNAQSSLANSYNKLDDYARTQTQAMKTPDPVYQKLGVRDAQGRYQQLNAKILQIENEYYSSIRPKRTINSGERPTLALQRRGVEYNEIRALDPDPFEPVGINLKESRFLDLFATYCLLRESPRLEHCDLDASKENLRRVVYDGRNTGVQLNNWGKSVSLRNWGLEKLDQMLPIAELFDRCHGHDGQHGRLYRDALEQQREKLLEPDATPSGRILDKLESRQQSFFGFAMNQALAHRDHFRSRPLDTNLEAEWRRLAEDSLAEQQAAEAEAEMPFEAYLEAYFRG